VLALAVVQFASESLNSSAAAVGTLPKWISPRFGEEVYRVLDRLAPAPYVESTLAQRALERGDVASAERYAMRLPGSPQRDVLLAQVARARGEERLALEYSLAAPDIDAVQSAAWRLAANDPRAGYSLEQLLELRLTAAGSHPAAVAEADWRMGLLANRTAWQKTPGGHAQRDWLRRAYAAFDAAVNVAPLSERYVIADANQADLLGHRSRAEALFARAAEIDPGSADAVAGLGVVALENGDRQKAQTYLALARSRDPNSLMVRALEHDLR
jgi:tetratricopeptide (TPR) repeat protein